MVASSDRPAMVRNAARSLRKLSRSGTRATFPSSRTSVKRGLSAMDWRSHQDNNPPGMLSMNGNRHPQSDTCSGVSTRVMTAASPDPIRPPTPPLTLHQLQAKPRRPGGADSARYDIEPTYSPPTLSPCRRRTSSSSSAAVSPIWW
jgi:hypothetical protein